MKVKANVRWVTVWTQCKVCSTKNRISNRVMISNEVITFCDKCRDTTVQKILYHDLDVRTITISEDGYDEST